MTTYNQNRINLFLAIKLRKVQISTIVSFRCKGKIVYIIEFSNFQLQINKEKNTNIPGTKTWGSNVILQILQRLVHPNVAQSFINLNYLVIAKFFIWSFSCKNIFLHQVSLKPPSCNGLQK
jgi:hypothetical protein